MNQTYDLIVLGGGPAGTSAAITAARDRWSVLLVERGSFPRHKVCGEFVSAESLELLRWLLGTAQHALFDNSVSLSETRLLLDGRCIRIPVNPPAASITRHDLDLALWKAAAQAGATTIEKTHVQQIENGPPFRVLTSGGEFTSRSLINASGRWSNLNSAPRDRNGSRWLGLKAHFHGEMKPGTELYFFDGGYCGVQPVRAPDGEVVLNVCALVRQGVAGTLEDVLQRHPALQSRSRSWRLAFAPLSTFPAVFCEPRPVSESIMNVGDAAGFVDPFVGDGIALALRGGSFAARRLSRFLRAESSLTESLDAYERNYRHSLRPVYRASSILRSLLGTPRGIRALLLSVCEASPWLAQSLLKMTRSRADVPISTGRPVPTRTA